MLGQRRLSGTLLIGATTLLLAFACGDDKPKSSCVTGDERCACYPNKSCNSAELVCLSNLCVSTTSGGSSGTGGSSSSATGGTPGEAGAGEGASTSSGGSAGADAGGSTGVDPTGGTTASGGKASNQGGSTGTTGGASAATGGASTTSGGTNAGAGQPGEGGVGAGEGEGGSTTSPDGNLISNGDFANGSADWNVTFGVPTYGVSTFTNGHACVQGNSSTTFNLGWPLDPSRAFVLEPGIHYTLSFKAMAGFSDSLLVIKFGHVTTPYTAAYLTNTFLTTTWASYSFDVVAASGDSAAGLVFQGNLASANSVCWDDVVLVKN
jgi:hypothetical protein